MTIRDKLDDSVPDGGDSAPKEPRIRKPALERTGPLRFVSTYGRFDDPSGAKGTGAAGRPLQSARDIIDHGIQIAYQVIDEQMKSGRRIAKQLGEAAPRGKSKAKGSQRDAGEAGDLAERLLSLYREFGELSLDVVDAAIRTPGLMAILLRLAGLAEGRGAAQERELPVRIASPRPVEADVSLFAGACLEDAVVTPLFPRDRRHPPITDVAFVDRPHFALSIRLTDEHEPDVYSGVITRRDGDIPLGTVIARVLDK